MKKKQWVTPECRKTRLVPEEALASGCKNKDQSGVGRSQCMGVGPGTCRGHLTS